MSKENTIIEAYREDVGGNARNDFDMCLAAISAQSDSMALVCRALDGMDQEMTDNQHTQVLTASHETLKNALDVINEALTVLADCEVQR